ncbi:MAG: DedA family protein [Patescibacteria group bacterium]|nr:DedA family protein [Patescibacteria group bacterium]
MTLQSYNIPIPSEVTMPFSGFLASRGDFNFWLVVLTGTFGNLFGAYLSYITARYLLKNGFRGKFSFLQSIISENNIALARNWFQKYGAISVFFSRMIPVAGTFISFPAGLLKMDVIKFLLLTFFGSFIWCYVLTEIGFQLGENWASLEVYFREFDYVILFLIATIIFWKIYAHFRKK